jgi:hypothetical protein
MSVEDCSQTIYKGEYQTEAKREDSRDFVPPLRESAEMGPHNLLHWFLQNKG